MQSEISQTEKDKYHMISFICGTKKKQTHRYRERIGGCQRWTMEAGGMEEHGQKVQTSRYRINKSRVVMHSTAIRVNNTARCV